MPAKRKASESSPRKTPTKKVQLPVAKHGIDDFGKRPKGKFTLDDGTEFEGYSFGAPTSVSGEVVFNTGMVGYPESLSDPSYRGQILVLTYPLVGNYGVPDFEEKDDLGLPKFFESSDVQITALIIADYSANPSHWTCNESLGSWLTKNNIPALYGIDTRQLTKKLRDKGACLGKIEFGSKKIKFEDPNNRNLVSEASCKKPITYGQGRHKIVAIDCGIKNNIIRYLVSKNIELKVVPWDYDITKENYDGLFISNGPGNPMMVKKTVENVKKAFKEEKPIFGICLGNQIMALAAGAKTYKMKFGNRGMNQPCIDLRTTLCYITPQNHGFAVDNDSLSNDWKPLFMNANDYSNEGLIHTHKPFFSVQFHPEAMGGPTDTGFLFDMFIGMVKYKTPLVKTVTMPPPRPLIKKVLLLGSGGLSIGQAGEFDYSGSQAIKALKEEGIYVVLINPNIATVQTSSGMADQVYFLPVTPHFVEEVIKKERPDGVLLQFGGQTALNCGVALYEDKIFEKYNVKILGTPVETIQATEDREIFARKLSEINESVAPSACAYNFEDAMKAAAKLGYPVLVRAGFALGGLGSGFADGPVRMEMLVKKAFAASSQVIIDKSLRGWKEVEYEVVRDNKDNCITVCNMENFDPLGIHTGDSIVVAPSQTLSNKEYYKLRSTAIKVIRHLGVIGECNIQYALDPFSERYCIIEVNARLSRSSALASKATGYPLAYVAGKLSLGLALTDIKNSVTKTTTACFEPALDYCIVKVPRWDMRKFAHVSSAIGSAMKSVGEVMAIGRTFEEAFQKSMRMVDGNLDGFGDNNGVSFVSDPFDTDRPSVSPVAGQSMATAGASARKLIPSADLTEEDLDFELSNPSDRRVFAVGVALQRGYSVDRLHSLTCIDKWFLAKLENIIKFEKMFQTGNVETDIPMETLRFAKRYGFSDKQIARLLKNSTEMKVRAYRKSLGITPYVKQIDTLAAEFPAQTNYLYMTYMGSEHDIEFKDNGVIVLGCGAYRIGSSCEFDWCAVSCIRTLRMQGKKSVMINYNPETVSTDYDECDRLYFEELSFERVLDIHEIEQSTGVVVSVGGQIPNNLANPLHNVGVPILGTTPESIDNAEDRSKFSAMLDAIHVDQPAWKELTSTEDAVAFADKVSYPVLVRPSYVLSGAAMNVAVDQDQLRGYLKQATDLSSEHPVVISKFILNAKEVEYDGVAQNGRILNFAISEHIENAGVHSGDATMLLPAQKLYVETIKRIKKISSKIAQQLKITGPFNIQYLSKNNEIKVIECNLRASRSFPFVSKTFNTNFIELATKVMIDTKTMLKPAQIDLFDLEHVCMKTPMFSFARLQGADPILRVEMASTGEVACFSSNVHQAFLLGLLSANFKLPKKSVLITAGPMHSKIELLPGVKSLKKLGYRLYGTEGTVAFYKEHGIELEILSKLRDEPKNKDGILNSLKNGVIDLVINIPHSTDPVSLTDGYYIRRTAVDFSIPLISNVKNAVLLCDALDKLDIKAGGDQMAAFEIRPWKDYLRDSQLV